MTNVRPAIAEPDLDARNARLMRLASIASVSTAAILIVAKIVAWLLTDSVALLSTLIDSLLDAGASLVTLLAVYHAVQPADAEHRFGHGKAEPLAGLAQAAFIAGSGLLLLFEAVTRFFKPKPISNEWIGIGVMLFAIALTLLLVAFQFYVLRRTRSVAVRADSMHYQGDLLINGSVIVSLAVSMFWSWPYLDPIFAIMITGYLLFSASRVVRDSLDMLMDRELPNAERERIRQIVSLHPEVKALHDLRSRRAGLALFIQLHLEVDGNLTLRQAHEIADAVEADIIRAFPGAEVIIHQDPDDIVEIHPAIAHQ
ncbi:MAG: cation diffusion facilitator family transporter [Alphaproteobacteria bacterium]